MKKIITALLVLISVGANAQGSFETFNDRDFDFDLLHVTGVLIGIFLFTSFILAFVKLILDGRIKSKMLEKGVSENVVAQFLGPAGRDSKSVAIKWFLVLVCIGIGLIIINLTLPVGLHSIAIMAFSISLSFLGYFYYIKRSQNQSN
jgi:hypothetical protein